MTVPASRRIYWGIVALTVANFALLVLWAAPRVSGDTGLLLFDERFSYSHAEALAFLDALSDEGRAVYLLELRLLDTLFPILLAISLAIGLFHLSRAWPAPVRLAALAFPALGAAFDLQENAAVAGMLRIGPAEVTAAMAEAASRWTSLKWVMDLFAGGLIIALLFVKFTAELLGRAE